MVWVDGVCVWDGVMVWVGWHEGVDGMECGEGVKERCGRRGGVKGREAIMHQSGRQWSCDHQYQQLHNITVEGLYIYEYMPLIF